MNRLSKLLDKLYVKQWSIGIAQADIRDIIRNKAFETELKWIPLKNKNKFYADPFIFKSANEQFSILYEEYDYDNQYGKISLFSIDKNCKVTLSKTLINSSSHLSYPFIFFEDEKMFIFPEASESGKLSGYHFDYDSKEVKFKADILNLPILDSTIFKHNGKYWLFGTMLGNDSNNKLHIYHSESLWGPYLPHKCNPVKDDLSSSRPAGNIIEVDGELYRPAQNSQNYYGSSITINKIKHLCEEKFEEEFFMSIAPQNKSFRHGVHTLNSAGNKIVIDGLGKRFLPFTQVNTFLKKNLTRKYTWLKRKQEKKSYS